MFSLACCRDPRVRLRAETDALLDVRSSMCVEERPRECVSSKTKPHRSRRGRGRAVRGYFRPAHSVVDFLAGKVSLGRRDGIRRTWGARGQGLNFTLRFFLGAPAEASHHLMLAAENAEHGDLVFISEPEDYVTVLTYKVAAMFWFATRLKPAPRWVLKADDDSFVNTPFLSQKLTSRSPCGS